MFFSIWKTSWKEQDTPNNLFKQLIINIIKEIGCIPACSSLQSLPVLISGHSGQHCLSYLDFPDGSGMRLLMKLLISGEKPGKPLWLALLMTDSSGPFRIFMSNSFISWMNVGYYFNLFPQRHWITGISAVVEWSRTGKHLWAASRRDSNRTRMPQRHRITGNAAIAANGHHVHRITDPQENLSPASLWFWASD